MCIRDRDYTIRARVSEGLHLAGAAKTAIAESVAVRGEFLSANNSSYALPSNISIQGDSVRQVSVGNQGLIIVTYRTLGGDTSPGDTLALAPLVRSSFIEWVCGNATANDGTATANNTQTSLAVKYLPANCR